ncbi:DNA repair and recombination protein rad54b [Coelomomyces lativittatus]|nr:DNA repair and recombination protein rad54b [Coelomomyces lativittatus]
MLKRNAPSQQRKQCLSQNALQNDVVETTSSSVSLRNSEKTKLDHQDINNNENTLLLHAKTSLKRKLPLESTNTSIMIKKYAVLWRVVTSKKSNRKNWDGDGILHCQGNMLRLFDANGNDLGKKVGMNQSPETNQIYKVGNKEVEITEELTPEYLPSLGNTKTISFSIPSNALLFSSPPNTDVNTVYLDPILSKHLRPHQWLGVQFLYACVMGFNHPNYHGALLCDEMGCGKTLQSIALIWTLLKQNPIGKDPVANKVLIVCPASLIRLWQAEFKKWLGDERVRTFAVDSKSTFTDFLIGRVYPIMIIGYEKLVSVYQVLHECPFDLIICMYYAHTHFLCFLALCIL